MVPEGRPVPQKIGQHRALDDIRDSIDELRFYRERVFVPPAAARSPAVEPDGLMRAVVLRSYGGPEVLELADVEPPVPTPDEILVDVHGAALNRADLLQRQGMYPDPSRAKGSTGPEILGMEYAGVVAAVGDRVTGWQVGDEVMGIETGGCYAEQVVTQRPPGAAGAARVCALDDAAAVPEVFITAWDALVVQGGLTSGRWALVHAGASGRRDGGDPDHQGHRRPGRGDVLQRQGRRLPGPRRRSRRSSGRPPTGRPRCATASPSTAVATASTSSST